MQLNRLYDLAFSGQISFSGALNTVGNREQNNLQNVPRID